MNFDLTRGGDKVDGRTCICLSRDIFNSGLLRHTGGNKVIRRRKWGKTGFWQNENDLRKRASAFSTNIVNTGSGDYLGDFGRYSSELLQSPPPSFFSPPRSRPRRSQEKILHSDGESRRRRPSIGTMVLLNQRNPSVSTTSFIFRYVLRAKTFVMTTSFVYACILYWNVWKRGRQRERGIPYIIAHIYFTANIKCINYSCNKYCTHIFIYDKRTSA